MVTSKYDPRSVFDKTTDAVNAAVDTVQVTTESVAAAIENSRRSGGVLDTPRRYPAGSSIPLKSSSFRTMSRHITLLTFGSFFGTYRASRGAVTRLDEVLDRGHFAVRFRRPRGLLTGTAAAGNYRAAVFAVGI